MILAIQIIVSISLVLNVIEALGESDLLLFLIALVSTVIIIFVWVVPFLGLLIGISISLLAQLIRGLTD